MRDKEEKGFEFDDFNSILISLKKNLNECNYRLIIILIQVVTPKDNLTASANIQTDQTHLFCVTDLHADISAIQGLIVEGLATAILVMVVASVWDARNEKNSDSVPIKFGLTVAVLATTVGPYTGCSMNPARSFAPALWNNQWKHHWVYWFGPIGGALISSFIYRTIFGVCEKEEEEEESVPEAIALNSVEIHKTEVKWNEQLIRGVYDT